ncbi:SpoIIE family protein phosphatase [Actinomadura sp. SCN-SB]|uniref:SpoIIE family protein phosphatase n=1 Tax=Actinomadura sp. SCN-SB TaxID=3373092 RepID=UPI003752FB0E
MRRGFGERPEEETPAIAVLDENGLVIGWSKTAEKLLGYPPEEILGRPGTTVRVARDRATRIWTWTGGSGDENYRAGMIDLRHHDGTQIVVHAESARIATKDGRHAWVVAVVPAAATGIELSVLEPLLTHAPVVMAVWDTDLRSVWLNESAQGLAEVFPYFEIGRLLTDSPSEADAPVPPELIQRVLEDGVPVIDREARWVAEDHHDERTYSTFLFRVEGVDGRPLGVCLMAVDITYSRARERLALLRKASIQIGTTLNVGRTAQELADLAVQGFADFCVVDLTDEVFPGPEPLQRLPSTEERVPVFRRAAVASTRSEGTEPTLPIGEPVYVPASSPFTHVLDTGESYLEPKLDTSSDSWPADDPERARTIRDTGIHTMIVVPLKARGSILGNAVFHRNENKTPFTRDDLLLAEELAARAALSLDNARQYTRERDTALALQRQLLPSKLSGGDAVELASRYLPSEVHEGVGGDWYDTILLPDSRVALIVGDVTGHGINAAASMGRLRTAMRTLAYLNLPPDELLTRLDELYAREADEGDGIAESPIAATCLYALYDPATRICTMASAGHLPPAVAHPAGEVYFPTLPAGTPIGLGLGPHQAVELELDEGTLMVLYTDGLVERRDCDIDETMRRLTEALARTEIPLDTLSTNVIQTMVPETAEDDVTLLLARTRTPTP